MRMRPALTWEGVAHHSHLYVLPAAGTGALVVGSLTLLGVRPDFVQFLPFVLTFLGATALLGSVASYMCHPWSSTKVDRTPSREPSEAGSSVPSPSEPTPRATEPRRSRGSHRPMGVGGAAVAKASALWDEPWRQWSTPRTSPLGAPLVGPVPATAYSRPKPGASPLFPGRDQDLLFLQKDTVASRVDRLPSGPRVAAPSRPSRPKSKPTVVLDTVRPTVGSSLRFPGDTVAYDAGLPAISPSLDSLEYSTYLGSVDPLSPHRAGPRSPDPSSRSRQSAPFLPRGNVRRFCTECSQCLEDFQTWVECRDCRRPLCRRCLHRSFSRGDEGSCSDCGGPHHGTSG